MPGNKNVNGFRVSLLLMVALLLLWIGIQAVRGSFIVQEAALINFTTMFISIILEAFPFVLFGVFISSLIQIFVTEDMLLRWIPKRKLPALLAASMMGLFFPICECANVPVARRLIAKGVPLHVGITFLMSVAIMNPVVLLSTYYAFGGSWRVALVRGLLGVAGAIIIGFLISLIRNPEKVLRMTARITGCGCDHDHAGHEHVHSDHGNAGQLACGCGCRQGIPLTVNIEAAEDTILNRFFSRVREIISHTSVELFSVGRFLIMGAFISSFVQVFLPRNLLMAVGERPLLSILILMALAYGLSLCSEADAFIARTFVGQFTSGAIMAFMIFGPMIDVKNTLMLLEGFNARFVVRLIVITSVVCFTFGLLINLAGW